MAIDLARAASLLREEAGNATETQSDPAWVQLIEDLSSACNGTAKTHIAFLGTAILAKAVDLGVDAFAVKARSTSPGAYSARSLAHGVLVPIAAELGINLGVTGREPLNNQPYFRMVRIDDATPVHPNARGVLQLLRNIIAELQQVRTESEARRALRSFIFVRRKYQPKYASLGTEFSITPDDLSTIIQNFVEADSEGGKRAQGVVAGLLDLFAGTDRVESGRINDPSRHYPGDVCIRATSGPGTWEKAFEVRDKPVRLSDVLIFGQRCLTSNVREAAVIAVAPSQMPVPRQHLDAWSNEHGVGLTVFVGWEDFVRQVLFWCTQPKMDAASQVVPLIYQRLLDVEVSEMGANAWISFSKHTNR